MSLIVSEVYDALIEAGASEAKAKAAAGAIPLAEHLATKDDIVGVKTDIAEVRTELAEVKAGLKEDMAGVRTELAGVKVNRPDFRLGPKQEIGSLKAELAAFEARFTQRLWLMAAIIVGLNVTLIKLLD